MSKRKRIDLSDEELIKIVKTTKEVEDVFLHNQDSYVVLSTWIREMDIKNGDEKWKPTKIYEEFLSWCKIKKLKNPPHIQIFGSFMKQMIHRKRINGVSYYMIDKTTAELERQRVKEKKDDKKETVKEED